MAKNNPTGMGYKTSRQFRRVANDIMKYANSVYEYNESNFLGEQWYDSHSTMRPGVVKQPNKRHATQLPRFNPPPSSATIGRRDRRKTSR